jgi:hypothetical protein
VNRSESIKEIAAAYTKAQPKIEGAVKDKTNPAFRSKYADLGSVVDAIKGPLSEHGLAFVQCPHDADHAARVETVLIHESGEWMSLGEVTVPVTKIDAHGFGSALTYARRYGLLAAFGVAPEDDDGNGAAKAAPKAAQADGGDGKNPLTAMKGDAFESLPVHRKEYIRRLAADLHSMIEESRDLEAGAIADGLPMEEQLGLSLLMDSKDRAALKVAIRAVRGEKPTTPKLVDRNTRAGAPAGTPQ